MDETEYTVNDSVPGTLWTEIPIVYSDEETPCYRVTETTVESAPRPTEPSYYVEERLLRDAASVTRLSSGTLTSTVSAELPSLLTLHWVRIDHEPQSVSLDLSGTSEYGSTAKVAAVEYQGGIRLILVDRNGVILLLQLSSSDLVPMHVRSFSIPARLEAAYTNRLAPGSLSRDRVVMIDDNRLVLALTPLLLAVDLDSGALTVWSQGATEAAMQSRWTRGLAQSLMDHLVGSIPSDAIDMEAVSALAVADNDPTVVWSLHATGRLRRWTLPLTAVQPSAVVTMTVEGLPDYRRWQDGVQLSARLYHHHQVYALAVGVTVSRTAKEGTVSPCRLCMVQGYVTDDHDRVQALPLQVPDPVESLVGLSLADEDRCRLVAWLGTSKSSRIVEYPPGMAGIVQMEPELVMEEGLLDDYAVKDEWRIKAISMVDALVEQPLEDAMHRLDTFYARYLFRPTRPRAMGTVLSPSPTHIRLAVNEILPAFTSRQNASVEVEVLRALHDWRLTDQRQRQLKQTSSEPPTEMVEAAPWSVYDSSPAEGAPMGPMNLDDDLDQETTAADAVWEEVHAHETRWQLLLTAVAKQEALARTPLYLAATKSDVVLVRPSLSSVALKKVVETSTLDRAIEDVMRLVEVDEELALKLYKAEQACIDVVGDASLAIDAGQVRAVADHPELHALAEVLRPQLAEEIGDRFGLSARPESELVSMFGATQIDSSLTGLVASATGTGLAFLRGRQSRLASASLVLRELDLVRRILLGRRLLILSESFAMRQVEETVLRMYLYNLALMWTVSQHVTIPISVYSMDAGQDEVLTTPRKRLSFSATMNGIVPGKSDKTTVLDVYLMKLGKKLLPNVLLRTGTSLSGAMLSACTLVSDACLSGIGSRHLSELTVLGEEVKSHPKLALRLLAPAVAFPNIEDEAESERSALVAECLLRAAHGETDEKAQQMASRALGLLEFDCDDLPMAMERLATIERAVDTSDRSVGRMEVLLRMRGDFIDQAIKSMKARYPEDVLRSHSSYVQLWSKLLNAALASKSWDKAFSACLNNHKSELRFEGFQQLVRCMVNDGALYDLLRLCQTPVAEDATAAVFTNGVHFYGIAAQTLAEEGKRDLYSYRATGEGNLSDYLKALYALHVHRGEWRKAAQALDMVYMNAIEALRQGPSNPLESEKARKREELIVDDLLLSSIGAHFAIGLFTDPAGRFIVSGEHGRYLSLPVHMSRTRTSLIGAGSEERGRRYLSKADLELRATFSSALATLFNDGTGDSALAKTAFLSNTPTAMLSDVVNALFNRGYFQQGLLYARIASDHQGGMLAGRSVFADAASYMCCTVLVPLATDYALKPDRPTLDQLMAAIDSLGREGDMPPVIAGCSDKKAHLQDMAHVRECAMALLRTATMRFTSSETPLAIEVAKAYVGLTGCKLPTWLENFLLFGEGDIDAPGLFARRAKPGQRCYMGDPSALLTLYTTYGMFIDGCRVVTSVLGAQSEETRRQNAPNRRPERGDLDFVPENKIDLLYGLAQESLTDDDSPLSEEEAKQLREACHAMEKGLELYYELKGISEEGLRSARAMG